MRRPLVHVFILALIMASMSASAATAQEATPPAAETDQPACAAGLADAGTPTAQVDATLAATGTPATGVHTTLAGWQTVPLTDARTGAEFTFADFLGCTVYVETMATWCSSCRTQLDHVATAADELDPDRFVFVAISIETELSDEDLARYADDARFDWRFAVATPEALKQIVDGFGRESIVPPSVPHLIVNPDGTYGDLRTGYSKPDEIVRQMTDASGT